MIFRPIEERDLMTLCRWRNELGLGEWQPEEHHDISEYESWFKLGRFFNWKTKVFVLAGAKSLLGFAVIKFDGDSASLGFFVEPSSRRRGVGAQIISESINYISSLGGVRVLTADTDVENCVAIRLLEKSNFRKTKLLQNYRFHHNAYHDSYMFETHIAQHGDRYEH